MFNVYQPAYIYLHRLPFIKDHYFGSSQLVVLKNRVECKLMISYCSDGSIFNIIIAADDKSLSKCAPKVSSNVCANTIYHGHHKGLFQHYLKPSLNLTLISSIKKNNFNYSIVFSSQNPLWTYCTDLIFWYDRFCRRDNLSLYYYPSINIENAYYLSISIKSMGVIVIYEGISWIKNKPLNFELHIKLSQLPPLYIQNYTSFASSLQSRSMHH